MITNSRYNQKGISSILFAMIFSIIVSLLAVGLVTLVRNDQRQTLDQTLGSQAQYAAESAINQVVAGLYNSPPIAASQVSCLDFEIEQDSGVNVPCVTWTDKGGYVGISSLTERPYSTPIRVATSYQNIKISYGAPAGGQTAYGGSGFPSSLGSSNFAVIRFTFLENGLTDIVQQYIIPRSGGTGTYGADGGTMDAACSGDRCTISIDMSGRQGYLSVAALGNEAREVVITATDSSGAMVSLLDAQYSIEATGVAQDITKRVEARVPANPQTWRPGYAVTTNKFCKDIKLDGSATNNNLKASDNAPTSCP